MSKPEILEKTPLSMVQLKAELNAVSKRDKEPGFRTTKTIEYLNSFNTLSQTEFNSMKKKIEDLQIPRLKEEHIIKILDIVPKNVNDLGVLLQGYTITVSKENLKNIVDITSTHKSK
jgi:DNA-directed RNA polymerase subunit F